MSLKVSCILPWGYGDRYIGVAVRSFLSQTYENRELVIVDNNTNPVEFNVGVLEGQEGHFPVKYSFGYIESDQTSVGALRNLGTSVATGEICINWDEDDWSHPDRIAAQVTRLQESGKAVTGWHSFLYYDEVSGKAYKYLYEPNPGRKHPPYACGTSQCYLKSWWKQHKFPETGVEDQEFSTEAMQAGQLDSCDAGQLLVAVVHKDSMCYPQQLGRHRQLPEVERDALPKEFFEAIGFNKKEQ